MKKDSFIDLEEIRLEILQEKIEEGIDRFKENPNIQWTEIRFEKPLLDVLIKLIEQNKELKML